MSELFDSYASDFQQLRDGIRQKLDQAGTQSAEARKATLRRAEMEVEEAEEVISQMDIEVQGFPQSVRSRYAVQIRGFKQQVDKLAKEIVSNSRDREQSLARALTSLLLYRSQHCRRERATASMPLTLTKTRTSKRQAHQLRNVRSCCKVPHC